MSIFARLGFESANTVSSNLDTTVVTTMGRVPQLLNTWQTTDTGNSDTTGYFVNPCRVVTQSIWDTANSIVAITGLSSISNAASIYTSSQNIQAAANNFMLHTDRISGITQPNASTATLPHYNGIIGLSKVVMQITFQSDGVQNNAPMMGNFTSLTARDNLNTDNTIISSYPTVVSTSMYSQIGGTMEDPITTYTTSLSPSQITSITNDLQSVADLMNARRISDVNFYNNCQSIVSDYNTLKQFSSPGQTESYLFQNYIGSPKLLSRLNS